MKLKIDSGIMLILLLIGMLTLSHHIQYVKAKPSTLTVPDNYPTIQWAIGNATSGDTIFVKAGIYYEHVTINKSISLIGENRSTTIIDGNKTGNVVKINAGDISLSGFTIQNSSQATYGIWLQGLGYSTIQGNRIIHNAVGIFLNYSYHNFIMENEIVNNVEQGICMVYSRYNRIEGNLIANSKSGISLDHCIFNQIDNNIIENNSLAGIYLEWSWNEGWEGGWRNTITGNTIRNNRRGIHFFASFNNLIYHNNFIGNTEKPIYSTMELYYTHFDNGAEGNYWSTYRGKDLNNDGIGDTPYTARTHSRTNPSVFTDNYPLMEPWSPEPSSPAEATQELIETIETWNLSKGTENCLTSKLGNTIHMLDKGSDNAATHKLTVLINQVEALQGKKLTNEQADYLVSEAQRIIDLING